MESLRQGGGISIGIPYQHLKCVAIRNGFELKECVYDEAKQREQLKALFTLKFPDIVPGNPYGELSTSENEKRRREIELTNDHDFWNALAQLVATFKHPSFEEEGEFRLISLPTNQYFPEWRPARGLPIEYTRIKLADHIPDNWADFWGSRAKELENEMESFNTWLGSELSAFPPIRQIVIGPHPHQDTVEKSIARLFRTKCAVYYGRHAPAGKNISVRCSKYPLPPLNSDGNI